MIIKSEQDILDIKNFKGQNEELVKKLQLIKSKTKIMYTKQANVNDIKNFFEKKNKVEKTMESQKFAEDIDEQNKKIEEVDEKSIVQTVFEQLYVNFAMGTQVQFNIDNVLDMLRADNTKEPEISAFHQKFLDDSKEVKFAICNTEKSFSYMAYDKNEKHPINIFLVDNDEKPEIDIYSNQMHHITSIPLHELEAFIISE